MSPKIAALGVGSDPVLVHFLAHARRRAVEVEGMDIRRVVSGGAWDIHVPEDGRSWLLADGVRVCPAEWTAVYVRLIDLSPRDSNVQNRARWRGVGSGIRSWLEVTGAHVVNRPSADEQNSAKPLHESWLTQAGFLVPDAFMSSDRTRLAEYASTGRTVVKTVSGLRGHAREVTPKEFSQFEPQQGPVHLQRLVMGDDVRAHVVGDRVISVRVSSDQVDYRRDRTRRHWRWELPDELSARLVDATAAQGLVFAGWDFKLDGDDRAWCLEANPMPGYKMYDHWLDGAISDALLDNLRTGLSTGPRRWTRPAAMGAPAQREGEPKHPWERILKELREGGRKPTCTVPKDPAACGCGSLGEIERRCVEIDDARRLIDWRLDAAAGWRGLLRKQVRDYALPGEPERYARAFDWLAERQPRVDEALFRELHDRVAGGRDFRTKELSPTAGFRFPSPSVLPRLVSEALAQAGPPVSPPASATALHLDLLSAHPYPDGNGRTSRLAATALLLSAGYRSTLFTAVEEFFHPTPGRYVELLDRFRFFQVCRDACLLGLLDAMFLASAGAAWFWRREQAVDEAMRAVDLDPLADRAEREAVESGARRGCSSRLTSELRIRGLSIRRHALSSLSGPGRALVLAQVDRVMREQRQPVPRRR